MTKRILITGATDGIGKAAAKELIKQGHDVYLHGRSVEKLKKVSNEFKPAGTYCADLSKLADVHALTEDFDRPFDVLINNAGVFRTSQPVNSQGQDVRFTVNTIAPFLLAMAVLKTMPNNGRIVNLSSAAQASVNVEVLLGKTQLTNDFQAYAQSKLAITQWTFHLASLVSQRCIALNPGSMLATKMVKEGFGVSGSDIQQGSDIIVKAALSQEFEHQTGVYFDNDIGQFSAPHSDALNKKANQTVYEMCRSVVEANH